VDDGGDAAAALPLTGQTRNLQPTEAGQSPPSIQGAPMSAVEKHDSESPKTRFAKDQLKAFVERIERLEEEKKTISDDIRDVFAESKANGFDVKALRQVIKLRKQDVNERNEQQAVLETYMHALGMLAA
jgi:uncharacterized protein (UPF0335 family)